MQLGKVQLSTLYLPTVMVYHRSWAAFESAATALYEASPDKVRAVPGLRSVLNRLTDS
jgi:hypothetical protein